MTTDYGYNTKYNRCVKELREIENVASIRIINNRKYSIFNQIVY